MERGTSIFNFLTALLFNRVTRPLMFGAIRKLVSFKLRPGRNKKYVNSSSRIMQEKKFMVSAILKLWSKAVATSKNDSIPVREFYKRYGDKPPWFLIIGPGHACNLKCDDYIKGTYNLAPFLISVSLFEIKKMLLLSKRYQIIRPLYPFYEGRRMNIS